MIKLSGGDLMNKRTWRKWKKKYLGLKKGEDPDNIEFWKSAVEGKVRFTWVSLNDKDTCQDCMNIDLKQPREGATWEEWVNFGLPGSGHTKCRERCRCRLAPISFPRLDIFGGPKDPGRLPK